MNSVTVALQQLQLALTDEFADEPGLKCLCVKLPLSDACDPLAWLSCQQVYPHFYWQQRNGDDEVAALGAVRQFSALADAQAFLNAYPQTSSLRIWGLNAFDPAQGCLFMSRLEWRRKGGDAFLWLHLYSETSLRDDAKQAAAFLAQILPAKPLLPLHLQCLSERHQPDRDEWHKLIGKASDAIASGELEKVVLARTTDLHFSTPVSAAGFMAASRRVNFNCYHFLLAFDAHSAFLGSSPERLWRRIDSALRTEALAGTVANHVEDHHAWSLGQWLLKDDKNQRENMLVVEDICQRLQENAGLLDVLPPQVVRLRKVQHLRRCIWTELLKADDAVCLEQLQPTAAVAGLPREQAKAFINDFEPFEREWYAGSAGYLSRQQTEFCVALRSAKITNATVRLYAGAGIVEGSDAELEWQEIENKAAGLRTLLTKSAF
ncbi:isochorismate synthase MenF [Enterobacteriaceae bacterium H18W14]|uniref:isochorismate synthase MenF n=1 Tax=Dryocola boscaweniae TaxID=2925397 RepID=UPI0022F0C6AD|nr:isochorismate synthase MenF [Dryocola boscaweniae]MCT4716529.1 isochorismate synthase MenF [Dryocola boscaweniae]